MANRGSAMSQLTCTKCGLMFMDIEGTIEEIPLKGGGSHLKCSCPGCGLYVKFLPHATGGNIFYFGKYKGKTVEEVHKIDPKYLTWLLTEKIGGKKIESAIRKTIQED